MVQEKTTYVSDQPEKDNLYVADIFTQESKIPSYNQKEPSCVVSNRYYRSKYARVFHLDDENGLVRERQVNLSNLEVEISAFGYKAREKPSNRFFEATKGMVAFAIENGLLAELLDREDDTAVSMALDYLKENDLYAMIEDVEKVLYRDEMKLVRKAGRCLLELENGVSKIRQEYEHLDHEKIQMLNQLIRDKG